MVYWCQKGGETVVRKTKTSEQAVLKECLKPHPVLHSVVGLGLGLVLVNLFGSLLGPMGLWIGVALVVLGIAGEFAV